MAGGRLKIWLVTGNRHKLEEARAALDPLGVEVEPLEAEKLEVQSSSLEEIALFAARVAYASNPRPAVAVEDAGLFVEALNGFPGPYSSYAYKTIGVGGLLKLLDGVEDRRACFRSAVALVGPGYERVFTGEVCGSIATEPRGSQGFGFDPVFIPEEEGRTFAEMSLEEKSGLSHRARAFRAAAEWLLRRAESLRGGVEGRV